MELALQWFGDYSYLFVNRKEIIWFTVNNKNGKFPITFCLEWISNGFAATESRKVPLKGNMYDFSVNYNAIDKYETFRST